MALDDEFVRRAERNRSHLDEFDLDDTAYLDWAVIVAFYTALRWVDAYFSPNRPTDHPERNAWVARDSHTRPIYREYRELHQLSVEARYGLREFEPDEVKALVANRLSRVEAHMRRQ